MEILLYDNIENKNTIKNTVDVEEKYDLEINLGKEKPSIYDRIANKKDILNFLDYLVIKIGLKNNKTLNYIGNNRRVWTYLLIFSYISKKISIKYKGKIVEESKSFVFNLDVLSCDEKKLKRKLKREDYEKLPEILKNLYYSVDEDKYICSKFGEIYLRNYTKKL